MKKKLRQINIIHLNDSILFVTIILLSINNLSLILQTIAIIHIRSITLSIFFKTNE